MQRRRFDHLIVELSVALGERVPRYSLWLELHEHSCDPEHLSLDDLLAFYDRHLGAFLAQRRWSLSKRHLRRLRRQLVRFDPDQATPDETMERLGTRRG